jgi:hypothetical protein
VPGQAGLALPWNALPSHTSLARPASPDAGRSRTGTSSSVSLSVLKYFVYATAEITRRRQRSATRKSRRDTLSQASKLLSTIRAKQARPEVFSRIGQRTA